MTLNELNFRKNAAWEKKNIVECKHSIKQMKRNIQDCQDKLLIIDMYKLLARYKKCLFNSQKRYVLLMQKANEYKEVI